jgi:hypothetical protein
MKSLVASVFALALLGAGTAFAQAGAGGEVERVGTSVHAKGLGEEMDYHHRVCHGGWYWRHHHRYCRRW